MTATGEVAPAIDESLLARAAATGDRNAFATLYQRYEQRAFNLAYRISGSEIDAADAVQTAFLSAAHMLPQIGDGEQTFGPYLFAATSKATHELMRRRHHHPPREAAAEASEPQGVLAASMRLPDRQREVLALCELEELSYDEIAPIMELPTDSVSQLVARARINLQDELVGSVLASAVAPVECGRALPLIATRQDGHLDTASENAAWLDAHLAECERCRLAVRTMEEAADSYSAWAPIAAPPWLSEETIEKAAGVVGADWGGQVAQIGTHRAHAKSLAAVPAADVADSGAGRSRRRGLTAAAGLVVLLLLAGGAVAVVGHDSTGTTGRPAASTTPEKQGRHARHPTKSGAGRARKASHKASKETATGSTETAAASTGSMLAPSYAAPVESTTQSAPPSHPSKSTGNVAVKPTRHTTAPKAAAQPATTPTSSSSPQPVTSTATTTTATVEAPTPEESAKHHEPTGKAVGRPPK